MNLEIQELDMKTDLEKSIDKMRWDDKTMKRGCLTTTAIVRGKTMTSTDYACPIEKEYIKLKLQEYKSYNVKVLRIYTYGLGEISSQKVLVYSNSKGWLI